ncbi:hypothetical protein D0Z00_002959 [Geotrichum galactomycetum]|uniref:Uncharacterized protein n=1 Tax=Geotrichum galactomycetum TaxID=27317 RepID=A0ACB6V2K4_9ASCO|nr:hypothetical protein D0Z00_002959 [Geotrichum candidum]
MLLKAPLLVCIAAVANAAVINTEPATTAPADAVPAATPAPTLSTPTGEGFVKRKVIASETQTSSSKPSPWLRTVSSTHRELVTPVIVGGVTFSAKPKNVKTPLPWLSVHPNGFLKTITPKVKNQVTQNASPDYGNWFDYPVTSTIKLADVIKDHDGEEDDTHLDVTYVSEKNHEDRLLNPIMRCTPDRYFKKKVYGEKIIQKPFCSPSENTNIIFGEVHWVTWYTRYFANAAKVRLHMAYVERGKNGILQKRGVESLEEDTFFTTEWMDNLDGVYPLEIIEDHLLGKALQDVVLSIQPDYIDDDEFSLTNGTLLTLRRYPLKPTKKTKQLQLEKKNDKSALYVALTIPTIMVFIFVGYAFINFLFRDNRTWKKIKIRSRRRLNERYTPLPSNTFELQNRS